MIDSCDDTERIVSAFLFLVASGAECLLSAYQNELSAICGCRLRAVLQGAIFKKVRPEGRLPSSDQLVYTLEDIL